MKRPLLTLSAGLALAHVATVVSGAFAAAERSVIVPLPRWLKGAETQTLDKVFGGAKPIHTYYISYPRKIAVIFEFKNVVICRTCSGPSAAAVPAWSGQLRRPDTPAERPDAVLREPGFASAPRVVLAPLTLTASIAST